MKNINKKFIKNELKKLSYLYGLNKTIRYNQSRKEKFRSQSVADHLTNMIFFAKYFRELEDQDKKLDFEKVVDMILLHDIGEIETGDIPVIAKKQIDVKKEIKSINKVAKKTPKFIAENLKDIFEEYEERKTFEAKFVKAIDMFETCIYWVNKEMVIELKKINKRMQYDIDVVHPIHMQKIYDFLDKNNFQTIKQYIKVIDDIKYSYGILDKKRQIKVI
jgi:putative hydrolase of HD superfamily